MTCWAHIDATQEAYQGMVHAYTVAVASDDDYLLLRFSYQMRLLCESIRDRHRRQMERNVSQRRPNE